MGVVSWDKQPGFGFAVTWTSVLTVGPPSCMTVNESLNLLVFPLQEEAHQRAQVVGLGEWPSAKTLLLNPLGAVHHSTCCSVGVNCLSGRQESTHTLHHNCACQWMVSSSSFIQFSNTITELPKSWGLSDITLFLFFSFFESIDIISQASHPLYICGMGARSQVAFWA